MKVWLGTLVILLSNMVFATVAEVWQKNPVGPYFSDPESDYAVTIDGARWLVRESGGRYWLGSYILDYPVLSTSTMGDVTVPSSLRGSTITAIPDEAFCGCDKITTITIPASITYISDFWTFGGCSSLTNFVVATGNTKYCAQDGLLLSKDKTCFVAYPCGKKGELVMPPSVTTIAGSAFEGCGFESIKIPKGVVSIGRYAFASSERVKYIEFPESLETIGECALIGCGGLTQGASFDFKGPPPTGVSDAFINISSTIRYNIAYEAEWLPVIEACGWTNANPYDPYPPIITDVTVQQRYPWNGKVDISYTVENARTESRALSIWAIDQTTGITNIAKNVTGDTAYASGQHHVVWDMTADGLTLVSTNVIFAVSYVETEPLYCVIDLSDGTSAKTYPVSYLDDVPAGGWSDEYKTTKLVLRKIKAGTFMMGSPTDEVGHHDDETQHQVTLTNDYWMGVFEVTQRQWELVMGTRPSYFNNSTCYATRPVDQVTYNMIRGSSVGAGWPNSSAVDATSFLGILRAKSGLTLDLPTEAQWEYACRAGTTTALNSGKNLTAPLDQDPEMDKVGRYYYNGGSSYSSGVDTRNGSAKVGSYAPNAWGLYDMHGNVWEWCLDWYGAYTGDITDPKGSSSGSERMLRGGSWGSRADGCRSAHRDHRDPSSVGISYGFRLTENLSDASVNYCGFSDSVWVDLTVGARTSEKTETLTYSTDWVEGVGADAVAEVAVDGAVISAKAGSGMVVWTPTQNGTYELTHTVKTNGVVAGEVLTATFVVNSPEMPVIKPASGTTFDTSLTVSMTCASQGATIHYTTNGLIPTVESPAYVRKFKIYKMMTVKAIAFNANGVASEMAVAEYAKGLCAVPVITAPEAFTGSQQRVELTCETKGAEIYFTTDGSDPTPQSTKYDKPFYVTDTTTVKAYATKEEYFDSDCATLLITREWGIGDTMGKPDHAFTTSGDKDFVRVEDKTATLGESMKSGAIGNDEKSILSTTVVGPGTLTFKWKASCEADDEYEWDHGVFKVDGKHKVWINGETDWVEVSQKIEDEGEHTVTWTYVKDDVEEVAQDCLWVSDYEWVSDYTETQTTEVPVPYQWLEEKSRDIVGGEYENYEKVAKQTAYNPRYTVEECYVAGLDPESTTNAFISSITISNNIPIITWKPDLEAARTYKIWGKEALDDGKDWQYPTNALHHFFKVTVEMLQ